MLGRFYRYADGGLPNTLAIAYTLVGYIAGVMLLAFGSLLFKLIGVLLLAHALIVSAYLLHEFAHQSIFKSALANARWGTLMSWINGSCYARFDHIRRKHMRHHVDRADVITFDVKAYLLRAPAWWRNLVLAAEWAYIPAVELIMHTYVIALPFIKPERAGDRPRVLSILCLRIVAFCALGYASPLGLALYAVAYFIMLTALRFADAYQHTYDAFAVLEGGDIPDDKLRDRRYEQANTYSNLTSLGHPWLNLLWLNFPYHNAHHEKPALPWYRLPRLHAELFPAPYEQTLPMRTCLESFHCYRVKRVLADDYGVVAPGTGNDKATHFYGAVGVSFLTAV